MIKWIKKLFQIVREYDRDNKQTNGRIDIVRRSMAQAKGYIKERTDLHIDLRRKAPSQIIMVGRYKNHDYVKVFNVQEEDLSDLIGIVRQMEQYGTTRSVDAHPDVSASFKREVNW